MQVSAVTALVSTAVVMAVFPGSAVSGDASLVATADVASGYTDNVLAVPETNDPFAPQVEPGFFTNAAPGLSATYETRRVLHNLFYRFSARLFVEHSEANSYSNEVGYRGLIALSPVSSLRVGAGFTAGRINAFDTTAADGHVADLPRGDVSYISSNGSLEHRKALTRNLDLISATSIRNFMPTNTDAQGDSWVWTNLVRIERRWRFHMLGAQVDAALNSASFPSLRQTQRSASGGGRLVWGWDITDRLSSNVYGGMAAVVDVSDLNRRISFPIAGASLSYAIDPTRFTAAYSRGVFMNAFTGDVTFLGQLLADGGYTRFRIPNAIF